MEHIDYDKFRFRIGDIVTYKGHEYPIVGYFFIVVLITIWTPMVIL